MREYYFPSGIPVTGFDFTPWLTALEIFYAVLFAVALGVFAWRCFCKPAWHDVAGWPLFIALELILAWSVTRYLSVVQDRFTPWSVWTPVLFWTIGLAFIAGNVAVIRYMNDASRNALFLVAEFIVLVVLLSPTGGHPYEASYRTQCKNQLKQIGLGMHNYHDDNQSFPPAGDDADVLTWRIALLPYLDEKPLFQHFHRNEPWNSPHNITLQEKRPDVYRCRSHPTEKRFTSYAMLRGPGTAGGDGTAGVPMKAMRDGTSNTALVVEACGREIVWTEPKDVAAAGDALGVNLSGDQPGQSRGAIASYHRGGAHVLLADGSVRHLSDKIDPNVIRMLSTYDDGERVPAF